MPEHVLGVLVDLGPLALREHVLEVEWMPAEARLKVGRLLGGRRRQMDPGEAGFVELSEPRCGRRDDDVGRALTAPGPLDPWQARHGD
jgi:hypothetical protein